MWSGLFQVLRLFPNGIERWHPESSKALSHGTSRSVRREAFERLLPLEIDRRRIARVVLVGDLLFRDILNSLMVL